MNHSLKNMTFDPAKRSTSITEQATPKQIKNNDGGYVFAVADMDRALRFLILGSESSFYQPGSKLALENATTIQQLAQSDHAMELVDLITDVSVNARAPKQSPGLFALAVVISQATDDKVKSYAYSKLSDIARTASTLFEFVGYLSQFQKLGGMGFQKAIGRWYNEKDVEKLAYQMVKYRQRGGYNHARLLRLSKRVKSKDRPELSPLLNWALGKEPIEELDTEVGFIRKMPPLVYGFERAKTAIGGHQTASLIQEYGLSWEMVPTEQLNHPKVWEALLDGKLPLGALIRQLPRLTNLGLITPLGGLTGRIEERLRNRDEIKNARIHPLQALVAMRTYASGRGMSQTWTPVQRIVDALEDAFYISFDYVQPTYKHWLLSLDLSASMTWNNVAGMPITPREASAAMAMITARTEPEHFITGFSGSFYENSLRGLDISPNMRLNDVIKLIEKHPAGGTNLSLPMMTATHFKLPVDVFVIYTDNEVNKGSIHPFQALQQYRDTMGIDAKLIVVGMTATKFTIANPDDPGMLDVAGFDTAAPGIMSEFAR